jgi:hypothetical protein
MREQIAQHTRNNTSSGEPRRQRYQNAPARRYQVQTDDVEEDESLYDPPSHSNVRRYTSTPPQAEVRVTHHRASARTQAPPAQHTPAPTRRVHGLVLVGVGMLVMLALWQGGSLVLSLWQSYQNDLHYGRPRTTQVDAKVGHNDADTLSHFIAVNLAGHIVVVEFPGGDAAHAKVYIGPIMAPGHELDPVTLTFKDVNGDGKPDMIIAVGEVREVFINDNGSFRPMRPGENVTL